MQPMTAPFIIKLSGTDTATCGDFTAINARGGPIGALTRKMVAAGACDMLPCEVWRGSVRCFGPLPLSYFSDYTISEGDKSVRRVRYVPMPVDLHGVRQ